MNTDAFLKILLSFHVKTNLENLEKISEIYILLNLATRHSKMTLVRANKTGINLMIFFILFFVENCLLYDTIHDFSVWLRTGSNPSDINRFLRHYWNKNYLNIKLFSEGCILDIRVVNLDKIFLTTLLQLI